MGHHQKAGADAGAAMITDVYSLLIGTHGGRARKRPGKKSRAFVISLEWA
jgi:hypothetical protein